MNDFTLKFVKITPSTINKADGQLQRMAEQDAQQEQPKTSAQLVFQERKNNLLDILSKKGGTDLSTLWKMRYHYIRSQCELEQNHSDFNRNGLAMVYDNVISKALVSKAYQITQDVAKEWDAEIHDLNHRAGRGYLSHHMERCGTRRNNTRKYLSPCPARLNPSRTT